MSTPRAYVVIGPAGSGKTSVARLLAERAEAAYLDKDTACTRFTEALLELAGTDKDERDHNPYYQSHVMELEYRTLLDLARDNLALGRPVVLDAPFGRYFARPGYLAEVAADHAWPPATETVVIEVRVDSATARERVRARGYARDLSKLADWDAFWKRAQDNPCRWAGTRRLVFDNHDEGITAATVEQLLDSLR
ncbi:AAA family ATPase [Streptomyces zingiberis]|uniref:ATP-binding protein n=1 Tax=Streptomyces zingiberis TaxID=2053010 RepID=A0ABX1BYX5_9ACTN|nr:ATP-binding protein [Streptomyces zingiberis]NJQ02881.1 ATP-binding protein [Streptomyces zingiberis]